ncbi:MAG: sulfite exporter TauE/SafE family protein [Chthonomonadales bacterium]
MTLPHAILLFFAGMIAGALNSVAGGGSFVSFPCLLFTGVATIPANATNTVAVWPGSVASAASYRKELEANRSTLLILGLASLLGGAIGATLLLKTRPKTFEGMLPWLLLFATGMFAFGGKVSQKLRSKFKDGKHSGKTQLIGVAILQFVIAIYGGFFGGGIGILMLATLALMGMTEIHTMNALKTVLGSIINGVAVLVFVINGMVIWPQAIVMVVGSIIGGYYGAEGARKVSPGAIRSFVITIGLSMSAWFFYRYR